MDYRRACLIVFSIIIIFLWIGDKHSTGLSWSLGDILIKRCTIVYKPSKKIHWHANKNWWSIYFLNLVSDIYIYSDLRYYKVIFYKKIKIDDQFIFMFIIFEWFTLSIIIKKKKNLFYVFKVNTQFLLLTY